MMRSLQCPSPRGRTPLHRRGRGTPRKPSPSMMVCSAVSEPQGKRSSLAKSPPPRKRYSAGQAVAGLQAGQQHIVFHLGQNLFGVAIHQMLRIVRLAPIARVPRAPHFLEGVINDRGQVIPVIDLHKRLGLQAAAGHDDKARILIAELDAQPVGMLVDAVVGIWQLPAESIQPAPEMVAQINGLYLTGVAHYRNHLIILLDLSQILTVQESEKLDAWQARAENG
jgi:purine-binding chemotaxis protein CheW